MITVRKLRLVPIAAKDIELNKVYKFIDNEQYTINSTSWKSLVDELDRIKTLKALEAKESKFEKNKLKYKKLEYIY